MIRASRILLSTMCFTLAWWLSALPLRAQRVGDWAVAGASRTRATSSAPRAKVIIDTDIGDDIDDAFALALALQSPELDVIGITTAWGDTQLRARLVERFLAEVSRTGIPVAEGIVTKSKSIFTQASWAEAGPLPSPHRVAVEFLLEQIRKYPGEITLIAIGPLTNLGAAIEKNPAGFRQLQRVVLMGGSIHRHYGDLGYAADRGPEPEYNILSDIPAAQRLFASGVPIFMMPLDSTQLKLDEVKRALLFAAGTPLTQALAALYYQWGQLTPTLFDAMAVAYAVQPQLCPVEPVHIQVDRQGYTRPAPGAPNASVCLDSNADPFFRFLLPRLLSSAH
jgi:inosine-uridine nucleoside N-ribohydrolase